MNIQEKLRANVNVELKRLLVGELPTQKRNEP